MSNVFNTKRLQRVHKVLTWATGGADYIPVTGPFNEVFISCKGTTDAHTLDGTGQGIARWGRRITVHSSKRGMIVDADSMSLLNLSKAIFNIGYEVDTVGGGSADGTAFVVPLGCDIDEQLVFSFTFGTLAEMCSTADLDGFTATVKMAVSMINSTTPGTYFAYFKKMVNETGIIGAATTSTQPKIPVLPGYLLTGELMVTFATDATTAQAILLDEIKLTHGKEYIYDCYEIHARLYQGRRRYSIPTDLIYIRHLPLENADATELHLTNGATASIAPSYVLYCYIAGIVAGDKPTGYQGEEESESNVITASMPSSQLGSQTQVSDARATQVNTGAGPLAMLRRRK